MPSSAKFSYIYREVMEAHWDAKENFLHSPVILGALRGGWNI